ncbi:MAG: hypothetical protein QXZ22_09305 [Sulfolobales archaeon]
MSVRLDKKLYFRGEKTPEFFSIVFSDQDLWLPKFESVFLDYKGEYRELITEFIKRFQSGEMPEKIGYFNVEIKKNQYNYNMLTVYVEPQKNYLIIAFNHSDDYNQFLDSVLKYVSIFE